jgi:hypothetical protein
MKVKPVIKRINTSPSKGRVGSSRLGRANFSLNKKRAEYRLRARKVVKMDLKELLKF